VQKQAIRDGVADFLVTSLDEALRILKNEIRKRETVAVCVAATPQAIEGEMLERGVLPDLVRTTAASAPACLTLFTQGAHPIQLSSPANIPTLLAWQVAAAPAHWLPMLDALALDCLDRNDWSARRWLRLAPRYLGRLAQGLRLLACDEEFAADFIERVRCRVESGDIAVAVQIQLSRAGVCQLNRFALPGDGQSGG
jgi:urocanate hydratase